MSGSPRTAWPGGLVPNLTGLGLLQHFLIAAVATVLVIRALLAASGYPRLGGGGIHVAHLLWGGALMLAALVILLAFLGQVAASVAAITGGIGFGLFIDELGKFITSDNNYFYRPSVSLIYLVFLLLFLLFRELEKPRRLSEAAYLANALRLLGDAAVHELDSRQWRLARDLVARSGGSSASATALGELLAETPHHRARSLLLPRLRPLVHWYDRTSLGLWFRRLTIAFFVLNAAALIGSAVAVAIQELFQVGPSADSGLSGTLGFAASLLGGALVVVGAARLRHSLLDGLIWFRRSLLVSIFLVDVFAFYRNEWAALGNFAWHVAVLLLLTWMIHRRPVRPGEAIRRRVRA